MSFNAKKNGFNVCPRCNGNKLKAGAFSFSPDCYLTCVSCGFEVVQEVSWKGCATEEEHDRKCIQQLKEVWNKLYSKSSRGNH